MSLQKITRLFDDVRTTSNGNLSTLKDRVRNLLATTNIGEELTKENFSAFLSDLFTGNNDILKSIDADMIFEQLQCSMVSLIFNITTVIQDH
ncbi:hypothetical protein AC249_AIPGENE28236 [Exaiptasia diaphana]|nr:hypothetical protein AC249_AIPGENE28236 [Exaiptasia diaphana]